MTNQTKKTAVLLTCYNRVAVTRECLTRLFAETLPEGIEINVFLVDDNSPDHTGELIKSAFPSVQVISGTGALFWCGGMRLAWATAAGQYDYDYYLLLNDDTNLLPGALLKLWSDYRSIGENGIITAACCDAVTGEFSYGGKTDSGPVIPCGEPKPCRYTNGNLLLVSRQVYHAIGGLSKDFTHGIGDYDYGLRTLAAGFTCWTTSEYLATCSDNLAMPWCDPKTPLRRRLELLHSPRGLNLREYIIYRRRHWPYRWPLDWAKAYLRVLFTWFYHSLRNCWLKLRS